MNEVFITKIIYKNWKLDIFLNSNKYFVKGKCPDKIKNEIEKIINSNLKFNKNKKVIISSAIFSVGLFAGVILNKDLKNIRTNKELDLKFGNIENELNINENTIDEKLFSEYVKAVYQNKNLTDSEKIMFIKRFNFVNKYKDYINKSELLDTLENIKINHKDEENGNVLGEFILEDNNPVINLYKKADDNTLIHEIYHALKHNKYYWDAVYFYEGKFIGSDEYNKLSNKEQEKCNKYNILGNMLEEANTAILTSEDKDVNPEYITYKDEIYLYKIYEQIIGKEKLEQGLFKSNQIVEYLNDLVECGCSYNEAIAIVGRLDLFSKFTYIEQIDDKDINYLKYQICDDLAYVYNLKFHNIDNPLLLITILSLTNDINLENLKENISNFKMPDLYEKLLNNEININNYLPDIVKDNYATECGINDITIDYFKNSNPQIYVGVNCYDKAILEVSNNQVTFKKVEGDSNASLYVYKLYTDYYEYALNQFDNDENYASFFASIYANSLLSVDQKAKILEHYDFWKTTLDNKESYERIILLGDYNKISKIFNNKLNENYSKNSK